MKQFGGFAEAKAEAQREGSRRLPVGAYVCKVLGVKAKRWDDARKEYVIAETEPQFIEIAFDINEGEYKDFFKSQYDANTSEDKKWKGTTRIYVPVDDGSEKDGYTKKSFAGWVSSFEKANSGYSWDWDEQKWKNKIVGIVFGETGTVIDGKEITYTEARFACDVERIKNGSAPVAKFKTKNGYTGNGNSSASIGSGFVNIPEGAEDEIPF